MRINQDLRIKSGRTGLELVPYGAHHVEKYHKWMEDKELRRLTGSERLSLVEEFEMQKKWSEDEDKLTFILLQNHSENQQQEVENMIGDVNLFIDWSENSAEVEIMLAEPNARGRGWAHEAVSLMLSYALNNFPLTDFYAKIKGDNVVSQNLFEKKLGFVFESRSEVFDESTFKLSGQNLETFKNYLENTDAKILPYP